MDIGNNDKKIIKMLTTELNTNDRSAVHAALD